MNLILGAGIAGLSVSYHLGHAECLLLEKEAKPFGHAGSEMMGGFTWDEGPHVSFTKHDYVKDLFARSVAGEFDEYEVRTANFFRGSWIDHPAQTNLYQIPEPLRTECLQSFLGSRGGADPQTKPTNYSEWLRMAFGPRFAETFPEAYTRKYWTVSAARLTTKWVGPRVFSPSVDEVVRSLSGPLDKPTHYITRVRYPKRGGFESFANGLASGARIKTDELVRSIDLLDRRAVTDSGLSVGYDRLINTLPLPVFVRLCRQATPAVLEAAEALACSQVLLVNVVASHAARRPENWLYVYDEDKFSTRINFTEKLTSGNAPAGWTGIQAEVYFSKFRPQTKPDHEVGLMVVDELFEMGLIDPALRGRDGVRFHTRKIPWANVIFDHDRERALEVIFDWLQKYGLSRDNQDLEPSNDWGLSREMPIGRLVLAGRFGQWKYFWTDDCVLRGKAISDAVLSSM